MDSIGQEQSASPGTNSIGRAWTARTASPGTNSIAGHEQHWPGMNSIAQARAASARNESPARHEQPRQERAAWSGTNSLVRPSLAQRNRVSLRVRYSHGLAKNTGESERFG
jgi:hypothetical protein